MPSRASFFLFRHQSLPLPCRQSVHGIMRPLPNFAMCELRIVFPHRFHRSGAITTRTLNGLGRPVPAPGGGRTTWHTRRRISSRKVQRGVSNVITLDSCLLCSSTTKSYSALTSKAKLPSSPPLPSFSSDSSLPRRPARTLFFPFFTL